MKGSKQEINYILEIWKTNPRNATVIIRKHNSKLFNKIERLSGKSFSEKCHKFVNNYDATPKCYCGNNLKYLDFRRGYTTYCSKRCTANSHTVTKKREKTIMQKYGVKHYSKTNEYKTKFIDTMITKYGVKNPGQISILKEKRARQKQKTFYNKLYELNEVEPDFSFDEYTHVRDNKLKWVCKLCSNRFESCIFSKIPQCPKCYPPGNNGGPSTIEYEIIEFIKQNFDGEIIQNSRTIIAPKEIDIYIPDVNLAIEVNGLYWHSDKFRDRNYHAQKIKSLSEAGINTLMVSDYEWQYKTDVVKKMIIHRLGKSEKINGRCCKLIHVTTKQARQFLEENHLGGFSPASIHLGLIFKDKLVSVLSFSLKHRFGEDGVEIVRLAFSKMVHGAVGKFLKYIKNNYRIKKIISYADLRYGLGNIYSKNGFKCVGITKPGYWYFYNNKLFHRLKYTKKKLIAMGHDTNKTEFTIMDEMGALRIYDAGHKKYILEINDERK